MTRKRDRFFAAFGALLFLVTASALTIAVIVNGISDRNNKDTAAEQTATSQSKSSCEETSISGTALPTPDVFKPTGDVKTLDATDLEAGTGATVKSGDCLQVKYYGTLASDGTVFDENYDKAQAFQFKIGQGQVIQGWDQGLIGAKVGATRRLVIPSSLAYGSTGQGSIPANAALVFVVNIVAVK